MIIHAPIWYQWLESKLEPSWPLMVFVALAIIAVTVFLIYRRQPVPLAAWLVYLLSP